MVTYYRRRMRRVANTSGQHWRMDLYQDRESVAKPSAVVPMNVTDAQTRAEEAALAAYPQLQWIIDMRHGGWRFSTVTHEGIPNVKGMYVWHTTTRSWGDCIQIRNINDAAAGRLNPMKEMVWKYAGDMVGAIEGLLELPHPEDPNAPRLVTGTVRGLWTP